MATVRPLVFVLALLLVAAATAGPAAAQTPEEAVCPVTPEEPVDPTIFADHGGRRVYFCCRRCRRKFLEAPEKYRPRLADASQERHHEHEDEALEKTRAEEPHDHATGHGEPEGVSRGIRFAGRFHPVVVHFPIALVIAAALAELLLLLTGRRLFDGAARFAVAAGAVAAIATALLGWAAGAFARYPGELAEVLTTHRWLGTAAAGLIAATWTLSELARRRRSRRLKLGYRTALFLAAGLVGLAGHFGATLIYGLQYYAW